MSKKIIAMIPARMGSKRIPRKNIRLLGGKPLVQYVVDAAKDSGVFDEIWVNSESDVLEEIATKAGVKFYRRSPELCTDTVGSDVFVHDFVKNNPCDTIVQILPTSPFITAEQIAEFVTNSDSYDTYISVKKVQIESVFNGTPINFKTDKPTPPSQDLTPVMAYACSLMAWNTDTYVKNMRELGNAYHGYNTNVGYYQIDGFASLDIDEEADFQMAEAILRKISAPEAKAKYYDDVERYDADRKRVLEEDGVFNNNMYNFNKEIASITEIRENNPTDSAWSHTLVNSKSNSATLIAQMPGEGNRLHYHSDWDEWWYILDGTWNWEIDGVVKEVKKNDMVWIERNKLHKITATGNKQAIRLAVSREDIDHIYPETK